MPCPDTGFMKPGVAPRAETDQGGDLRHTRPAVMDDDRPLSLCWARAELAGVIVAIEHLRS